ncbi:hypothetical protein D3C85_1560240 [compost metagenome]
MFDRPFDKCLVCKRVPVHQPAPGQHLLILNAIYIHGIDQAVAGNDSAHAVNHLKHNLAIFLCPGNIQKIAIAAVFLNFLQQIHLDRFE